jgi:hypothetical protein
MTDFVGALDDALLRAGTDITLRRVLGVAPTTTSYDVTVRAAVRSFQPEELVGGISQTDSHVIISPTQIAAAGWPGDGESPSVTVPDPTLPRINDKLVIAGRVRNVKVVQPIYINGELVRIEMNVSG